MQLLGIKNIAGPANINLLNLPGLYYLWKCFADEYLPPDENPDESAVLSAPNSASDMSTPSQTSNDEARDEVIKGDDDIIITF